MHNASATIYCTNPACQAPNPESHQFCQQCRTPIVKRYLWAVGANSRPGELLGGRYLVKQSQIVLDTQPGLLPESTDLIGEAIAPYLRLSPYPLHVPQLYGLVEAPVNASSPAILLLEQAPIVPDGLPPDTGSEGTLFPELTEAWKQAPALRQLNWLWQMAHLWGPLSREGVASTLLTPDLLRVEGSLVRLLELRLDGSSDDRSPTRTPPTLSDLGQLWRRWQPKAQAEVADFMGDFCQQLIRGQVRSAEQLIVILDRALLVCGQLQSRQIQLLTRTDQGPTRQRNEDACYPPDGSLFTFPIAHSEAAAMETVTAPDLPIPFAIVCDGIGGHEGGNVASNLAIACVQQQLQPTIQAIAQQTSIDAVTLSIQLEQAVLAANDAISQRNDAEQRQERQRMGTTLVMALFQGHEVYLTHVGDSRAYRITSNGCHQVTLDDDLAAREMRLGYALYRDALQQPGAGSLVQALGMGASSMLHPTVQRFVLDEDCLFLLCSDGLSDYDRVEALWRVELLPVLAGEVDLATAADRLVALANSQNGHDNVTIGLIHAQVLPTATNRGSRIPTTLAAAPTGGLPQPKPVSPGSPRLERRSMNPWGRLVGMLALWLLGGVALYGLIPDVRAWVDEIVGQSPNLSTASSPPNSVSPPTSTSPVSPASPLAVLSIGSLVQLTATESAAGLSLQPQPGQSPSLTPSVNNVAQSASAVPAGAVLQIAQRQTSPTAGVWLQLKVCSLPPGVAALRVAQPGELGWVPERTLAPIVRGGLTLTATELGTCAPAVSPDGGGRQGK
jgi:serine/threonine protein phosphatase PrpC